MAFRKLPRTDLLYMIEFAHLCKDAEHFLHRL